MLKNVDWSKNKKSNSYGSHDVENQLAYLSLMTIIHATDYFDMTGPIQMLNQRFFSHTHSKKFSGFHMGCHGILIWILSKSKLLI